MHSRVTIFSTSLTTTNPRRELKPMHQLHLLPRWVRYYRAAVVLHLSVVSTTALHRGFAVVDTVLGAVLPHRGTTAPGAVLPRCRSTAPQCLVHYRSSQRICRSGYGTGLCATAPRY